MDIQARLYSLTDDIKFTLEITMTTSSWLKVAHSIEPDRGGTHYAGPAEDLRKAIYSMVEQMEAEYKPFQN